MTITKLNPTIEAIWGSERRRKSDDAERVRDLGPPWRDLIGKYLYWGDVSEKKPVEIWTFKTDLGQGLRPC